MKKRLLGIAILLSVLLFGAVTARAQGPEGSETVLLLLPVPQPQGVNGVETAEAYTFRAAEPLLERLSELEARGQIESYELLPDRHAVQVRTAHTEALRHLRGVEAVFPLSEEALACSAEGSEAVDEVLHAADAGQMLGAQAQATNPSIYVYYRGDYGSVRGNTDSDTTVQMVLKDASGTVKINETTTSSSSGYYSFYPDWQTCLGYDWQPEPGDTVEVTAAGNTVSMVVADISAFADPDDDTVSGSTAPNRTVEVSSDATGADCDYTGQSNGTTSDGAGEFSVKLDPGFDRSVSIYMSIYDANDNATHTHLYPPRIELDREGDPSGYLRPNVRYTAALMREGSTVASFSGKTGDDGSYAGSFAETVQPGDVIEVSGGGETVSTTFVALDDLSFDLAHDRITGHFDGPAAGRSMRVSMERPWYSCQDDETCVTDAVEGNGDFVLDFGVDGFDLQRGDEDYAPAIYDDEGNHQELRDTLVVPIVVVESGAGSIGGNWREPNVVVTMTVRDAGGAVKETDTDTTSSYDAGFWGYFWSSSIETGDIVDVTDGSYTLTVSSVPTLTAYLDSGDDTASGVGPEGSTLDVRPWQYQVAPIYDTWSVSQCYTDTVTEGSYSADLSDQVDIEARDRVAVYYTTSEGHEVAVFSWAFTVDAEKGTSYVTGYTPAPRTGVLVELWRNGSPQAVFTTTSSSYGSYSGSLANGTPVTITRGDTVRVKPEDVPTYSLSIPELTVEEDPARNEVKGRGPSNAALKVQLDQSPTWNDWGVLTTADAEGDYVVDFDGVYEYDCTEAEVGLCTRPRTTYYNDDGHSVYVQGPEPAGVSADAFEPDDEYSEATSYTGVQSHTFHAITDTDWISFTVTSDDVGTPYYLKTVDLGVNANTSLALYELQGGVLHELGSDASYTPAASEIAWTPSKTGTYYVEVEPYGYGTAEDCGSTYNFFIARHRIYLPLVIRGE